MWLTLSCAQRRLTWTCPFQGTPSKLSATFRSTQESFLGYQWVPILLCLVDPNRSISVFESSRSQTQTLSWFWKKKAIKHPELAGHFFAEVATQMALQAIGPSTSWHYNLQSLWLLQYVFDRFREKLEAYQATMHTGRKRYHTAVWYYQHAFTWKLTRSGLPIMALLQAWRSSQTCFYNTWHATTVFCVVGAKDVMCFVLLQGHI